MSNPYASPTPESPEPDSGWSAQQPAAPQGPPSQPAPQAGPDASAQGWGQPAQPVYPQAAYTPPQGGYDQYSQQGYQGYQGYQGAYGAPGGYPGADQAVVDQIKSNSVVILVLGILGLVLIGLFGSIPAWIWGNSTIRKAQGLGLPASTFQYATIGKILGIIGTALWAIGIVIGIIAIILLAVAGASYDSTSGSSALATLLPTLVG